MIKGVLKFILFASLILWVGQFRIAGRPVAVHFQRGVRQFIYWGHEELSRTKFYGSFVNGIGWKKNPQKPPVDDDVDSLEENPENISNSDRESIMRLLQN